MTTYDHTNLSTPSVSESDAVTLVDAEGIATPTTCEGDMDLKASLPMRSQAVRKRRVYNVFGLLTNRYIRSRKANAAATTPATTTSSSSAPTKQKKQKKAKPFKYKGEMLNNQQDQFIIQCVMRLQMFGACNVRDAALIVEREWRSRGIREDKMPQYECPDMYTLVVPESTAWLAEHEPERLAQYLADRKLGIELPF